MPRSEDQRGQVLILFAIMLVVLLGVAGLTIDIGRQVAERRHVQTAADAGALAACRALAAGASNAAAALEARAVARINLENSPSAGGATIAADTARIYEDGHAGDPSYLASGVLVSGTTVRVAIMSTIETALARVVGVPTLDTNARARCQLQGGPAVPIVARRYAAAPGPEGGFIDFTATVATSVAGQVDAYSVLGYDGRTPASELQPGPVFELYGPNAKAANESAFRGFVALDVRDYESTTSRSYYNGVQPGITENTLKDKEGEYLATGYPGPAFPPIVEPADPADQVGVLLGNDTAQVVKLFKDAYRIGDRLQLAVYNGTVMQIPDFALSPPAYLDVLTTQPPTDGPNLTVTRNDAFNSTVTLRLRGDVDAAAASHPEQNLVPESPVPLPAIGQMNQPTWSTNVFIPDKKGTKVTMGAISTNTIPVGIYTVWLEGSSGDPYFQTRRVPLPVIVGEPGEVVRDFSLANSTTSVVAPTLGSTVSVPLYVSTANAGGTTWGGGAVQLSWDTGSFTDCALNPATILPGQITLTATSVTPASSGSGALSTLSMSTVGLAPGCYRFNVRAYGRNGAFQPVVHLQPITLYVATEPTDGAYVDVIGFAVFEISGITNNAISGRAVTGVVADPTDQTLRRAQRPRLIPW